MRKKRIIALFTAMAMIIGTMTIVPDKKVMADIKLVEIASPTANGTYYAGEEINITLKPQLYIFGYYNYLVVEIKKGTKQKYFEAFSYTNTLNSASGSFIPKEEGTYTINAGVVYSGSAPYAEGKKVEKVNQSFSFKVAAARKSQPEKKKKKSISMKKVVPNVKVERVSKKAAEISWTNQKGKGTMIYRAQKKKGKYKLIKKTSKAFYTDKKLKAKKTYYYKIRYYNKKGKKITYSKFSKVQKVGKYVKPMLPTITSLSYTESKGVCIKWKYTGKADVFYVLRSDKKNSNENLFIEEAKKDARVSYDKDAEKGKTYYYMVVAVKNPDSDHPEKTFGKDKGFTVPE